MPRTEKIPSKADFYNAIKRAYELLIEFNISSLPVDPFLIIEKFEQTIKVCKWSELKKETGVNDPLNLKKNSADAKTMIIRNTSQYLIVYDDSFINERVRWTIAHELGHIFLGHLIKYEDTALNRGGLIKDQYDVLELEAHWFAEALFAPNFLLKFFNITNSIEIQFLCDISKEASEKCTKHILNFYPNETILQMKLLRNFYNFFDKQDYLNVIHNNMKKFYRSNLYAQFCSHCRICKHCNAFITNHELKYCHICGNKLNSPEEYTPFKNFRNGFYIGYDIYLKGKYYRPFIENNSSRILFCYRCKNHDFYENSKYCPICGAPLYNMCSNESKLIGCDDRYCPDCGSKSLFEHYGVTGKYFWRNFGNFLSRNFSI